MGEPGRAPADPADPADPVALLARLSGRPGGPDLELPAGLVPGLEGLGRAIGHRSSRLGRTVELDPVSVVTERAVAAGLTRRGDTSCGGACRLLPATDGWVAVSLARPEDWALTAAWLELGTPIDRGRWDAVATRVATRAGGELVERAVLCGMAVARVGERARDVGAPPAQGRETPGIAVHDLGPGDPAVEAGRLSVVDLSTLWAGPLAGSVLRRTGARVLKVESTTRPDGARRGPPAFFASLNGGKEQVTVDVTAPEGHRDLTELVSGADVVVSSARFRALVQLGLDPAAMVGAGGPAVWLAVTGYGGDGSGAAGRVAFGDDAAAAGGLVVRDEAGPCFCGDALADPATGLAGAAAVLDVLSSGRRAVIVASLADVAAGLV